MRSPYTYTDEISFGHRVDGEISSQLSAKHSHEYYEIIFVVAGSGRYIVEGTEYDLRARTIALIPPLSYHCLDLAKGVPYERYVIHFHRTALSGEVKNLFQPLDTEQAVFYSPDAVSDAMISLFERFEWANSLPRPERESRDRGGRDHDRRRDGRGRDRDRRGHGGEGHSAPLTRYDKEAPTAAPEAKADGEPKAE